MSSENIDLINRIYKAFENRDTLHFSSFLAREIDVTQCPQVPRGGVFQGIDEAKCFFGKVNTYLDGHVTIEHIIDGGDRIAVIWRTHGIIKVLTSPSMPLRSSRAERCTPADMG